MIPTNRTSMSQQSSASKHTLVPLLKIPQAKVQIYTDCIVKYYELFSQAKTTDTGQFTSLTQDTKIDENKQEKDKIKLNNLTNMQKNSTIMFNNPDYAFNINQHDKQIEIHNLVNHSIILKFNVNLLQTLLTIQSLLRRKMCELGFQNKYKIISLLGKGATAQVHLIERITDGKQFAAKIISIKQSNDKSYETFINQSKLLRILKHKNIINLQSLYIYKKQLIQVMQYLNGGTLLQLLKNDKVRQKKQKWRILRDITNGLDYLRQRRIVHRDIKMQNILIRNIGQQRQYVISDFGLASWIGQAHPLFQRCGTPGYIAPQVLNAPKGKPVLDHKTDVFSLGSIAHILFLHQPLFPYTGNVKQLLKANKKADFKLQGHLYEDLSINQITFLQMTLQKTPSKRSSTNDLIKQFKYITSQSISTTPPKSAKTIIKQQMQSAKSRCSSARVQVQVKKATSLTKTKINISDSKNQKTAKQKEQQKPVSSARKLLSDFWNSLTTPSPKKEKLKIKQNSVQKQKKLTEYFQ